MRTSTVAGGRMPPSRTRPTGRIGPMDQMGQTGQTVLPAQKSSNVATTGAFVAALDR